ncbi:winged helix-turn-helix domain-containing protein, partial [Saccharomonospora sp. NPDC046836]|uniref:winged helix-turn-helix domain-containing protein n=2 Tax=Actinomycetes TaxID=1760 RepID=UPI003402CF60
EFALLELFLRHPGQVLSREQILSHVWGYDFDLAGTPGRTHLDRRTMAEPRYPLLVGLPGGRVQDAAKLAADGEHVFTLCRKRGRPDGDGGGLPYCRACANRPNPISQQAGR